MPEVSVVIPTFNSQSYIKQCLDSLFLQSYSGAEVIVVDNGSNDSTVELIKDYPSVVLIKNNSNLGACRARNQAIAIAKGGWVLAMDCDTVLPAGFLKDIMAYALTSRENLGAVQPKIIYPQGNRIYSCGIMLSAWVRFYDIGRGRQDKGQYDSLTHIFGACSACTLYKKAALDSIKEDDEYFDEDFFFLLEDADLSFRLNKAGFKVKLLPEAICYHQGRSSPFNHKLRQYLCWRNRNIFIAKHKLSKYASGAILFYDLPRDFLLLLTNPYFQRGLAAAKNHSQNNPPAG